MVMRVFVSACTCECLHGVAMPRVGLRGMVCMHT